MTTLYASNPVMTRNHFFHLTSDEKDICQSSEYQGEQAKKTADFFIQHLQKIRQKDTSLTPSEQKSVCINAKIHLRSVLRQEPNLADMEYSEGKKTPLYKTMAKLDRYVAAEYSRLFSPVISGEDLRGRYLLNMSKDQLDKWITEPTHAARKVPVLADKSFLVASEQAEQTFFEQPEEVDFLTDSFIYKQMARLNEQIKIIGGHHFIRFEGQLRQVNEIIPLFNIDKKGKIFSKHAENERYYFLESSGLSPFDPEKWTDLPVYRTRKHPRSENDFRLVIKTVIRDEEDVKHSWMELKSPTSVYNVGYFWDDKYIISPLEFCKTVPGALHCPDKNELIGKEKDVVKTVCSISQEQFAILKKEIEKFQAYGPGKPYNFVNSSCSSWLRHTVEHVGLELSSQENLQRVIQQRHFSFSNKKSTLFGKVERAWHRVLAFFRNLLIYILGGGKSSVPRKDQQSHNTAIIRGWTDLFDLKRGLVDYPKRIREWQLRVAEKRQSNLSHLISSSNYPNLSEEEKEIERSKILLALPIDIQLPEPEITF
ncbi:MAG: hypothetical protein EBZ47_04295 [Chlamydiae bacterium]|nr:hypothetical protein [Chlamydiota bacterium]